MRAAKKVIRFADIEINDPNPTAPTLAAIFVGRIDYAEFQRNDFALRGDFQMHMPNGDAYVSTMASVPQAFAELIWDALRPTLFGYQIFQTPGARGWTWTYEPIEIPTDE